MMSCGSSVSVQKPLDLRSRSCETTCTSNSSCVLQRRKKQTNPLAFSINTKTTGSTVRQRVLSAKLVKLRSIQNKLNDAQFHLHELSRENQALKTLQKRQDKALSKYESDNADLPRLLHIHEEEIRTLSEKNKQMKKSLKEANELVKSKDEELLHVKEQLKHLEKLNKNKKLTEREKLMEQVDDLKEQLQKAEEQISLLNRKILLESKSLKQKLNAEISKHKITQRELNLALSEIDRLSQLIEVKPVVQNGIKKSRIRKGQSVSMISLNGHNPVIPPIKPFNLIQEDDGEETDEDRSPVTEVKLEPIVTNNKKKSPKSNITEKSVSNSNCLDFKQLKELANEAKDMTIVYHNDEQPENGFEDKGYNLKKTESEVKIKQLSNKLDQTIQKVLENGRDEFDLKLGDYCTSILNGVKNCSKVIDNHKKSLQMCKEDTDALKSAFEQAKGMEVKLQKNILTSKKTDLFENIEEELKFDKQIDEESLMGMKEIKNNGVKLEEKKKLLATLRAIDNGESFGSNDDLSDMNSKMLKEIFGE